MYAVALDSVGKTRDAVDFLDVSDRRWPNQSNLAFLQVAHRDKLGVTDGIESHLKLLMTIAPDNPQVVAWWRKYQN